MKPTIFFLFTNFCYTFSYPTNQYRDHFFFPPKHLTSTRLIGGHVVKPHEFPYQAGLYVTFPEGLLFCGGSLISNRHVLTAAHCLDGALGVQVVLGAHNVDINESTQKRIRTDNMIVHAAWDLDELINDVALIKLPEDVEEDDNIKIVPLASGDETYANALGNVTGWGVTSQDQDDISPVLMYLDSNILSNEACKSTNSAFNNTIKDSHLCLDGKGNRGVCSGDSGGPLVVDGVQVGIVSFSYVDCASGFPSVFTRVTHFKNWIDRNMEL